MAATIWKGHLTFGLVSVPIKLFRAARAEKIHMHRLQRSTGARVKQMFVPADDSIASEPRAEMPPPQPAQPQKAVIGPSLVAAKRQTPEPEIAPPPVEPVPRSPGVSASELVKGYEFEKDRYVAFEPEELESIAPKTSDDMQIVEFVHFKEVDPIYLESSYYVAADKGGDKPYALLFEALKKTGYAAIAEFVMHRRDQTMILRAGSDGIVAHTLFYEDEIKRENAFPANPDLLGERELDLAVKLVNALAAKFDPTKLKDKYRERLHEAIAAKVNSGVITHAPVSQAPAPVVDIMEALRESLQAAKRPVAREASAPEKKKLRAGRD